MKSKYSFEKKFHYLQMKISGEYDKNEFLSFPEIFLIKSKEAKMSRILVDTLDVDYNKLSIIDRFFLGEELAEKTRGEIKIAIVVPAQYINKFVETVAINRGANVFIVDTIKEAKEWLT